jgi:hypothetical protein
MPAPAVMERKATPHLSARRSPKAPSAHSAEVASGEAAAEAPRVAAPAHPAASVAAAPAGVRSCCNGASGERAREEHDHHLFQHLNFPYLAAGFAGGGCGIGNVGVRPEQPLFSVAEFCE